MPMWKKEKAVPWERRLLVTETNRFVAIPVPEQDPNVRNKNFEEVCLGYSLEDAQKEASRCLSCKVPQCRKGCPVSVNIPEFIGHIKEGNIEEAARSLWAYSALPAVCGRVCPQENQCEKYCVLKNKGDSVSIGKLERFAADYARNHKVKANPPAPFNGHKVAIIGGGPAGLTCAGELAKKGFKVHVFEALQRLGGVLIYGIPSFRLPDEVVEEEVKKLEDLGVEFETNVIVGRTVTIDALKEEGFEAFFIGSGAGLPRFMNIPGENLNGVFSANEFLTRTNLMHANDDLFDTPLKLGQKVAVIGGGNVAMDAARVSKRLGSDVTVVYRRTEKELPARSEEVHHAKEEGIHFKFLTNPVEILGDEDGWTKGIRCIEMELGEPDASGRRRPVPIQGSEFDLAVDTVIMALGTSPNPLISMTTQGLETEDWGGIIVNETGQSTREDIFAGGDAVTGAATVILAMGAGKEAAKGIEDYLLKK